VRSQWPDHAEIPAIKRQDDVGAVFSGQRDIDRIGEVQLEVRVLLLNLAGSLQARQICRRDHEAVAPGLFHDEIDDRGPCPCSEADFCEMIDFGQHQCGQHNGARMAQYLLAAQMFRRVAVRGSDDARGVSDDDHSVAAPLGTAAVTSLLSAGSPDPAKAGQSRGSSHSRLLIAAR
jgi:hypothetical protein